MRRRGRRCGSTSACVGPMSRAPTPHQHCMPWSSICTPAHSPPTPAPTRRCCMAVSWIPPAGGLHPDHLRWVLIPRVGPPCSCLQVALKFIKRGPQVGWLVQALLLPEQSRDSAHVRRAHWEQPMAKQPTALVAWGSEEMLPATCKHSSAQACPLRCRSPPCSTSQSMWTGR